MSNMRCAGIALLFGGVGDGARAFDDIHVYYADQCRWQRIDAVGAAPTARYNHRVNNWVLQSVLRIVF